MIEDVESEVTTAYDKLAEVLSAWFVYQEKVWMISAILLMSCFVLAYLFKDQLNAITISKVID